MKYSFFIFAFILNFILFSQETKINETYHNIKLSEVLRDLEKKYNIKIAYDPQLISDLKISADVKNLNTFDGLKLILKHTPLSINKVRDNYFTITPSEKIWEINGILKDNNGNPIPYAKLWILGSQTGGYTDLNGVYRFSYQNDNDPSIEISSIGFATKIISGSDLITKNGLIVLDFDNIKGKEVLIEYLTEGITIGNDISHITIRPKKMGASAGSTEPDIFQMAQNIPGINSANSSVSDIQIRGGSSDQNHILWEDIEIYHPGHFYGLLSSINPNIIDKTELYRDVYDPYYGGKISGMIKLSSIDYIPKKIEFGGGANMLQGDTYVKVPIGKKIGVMISGRSSVLNLWSRSPTYQQYSNKVYQQTELQATGDYVFESLDLDTEDELVTSVTNAFKYSDINGKIIFKPTTKTQMTFSGLHTVNRLNYYEDNVFNDFISQYIVNSFNTGLNINLKHNWNDRFKSEISASHVNYFYYYDNLLFENGEIAIEDAIMDVIKINSINSNTLKTNNILQINDYQKLSLGYQFSSNLLSYEINQYVEDDSIEVDDFNYAIEHALNLNHTFKKNRILTNIGVRMSQNTLFSKIFFEPRFYGQYKVNKRLTMKASTGIQNQFISQISENENTATELSNKIWVMANNESDVLQSKLATIGCFLKVKDWQFEIDFYGKKIYNLVNLPSSLNSLNSNFNKGNANILGVDVLVKKRWNKFNTWLSYSYNKVDYTIIGTDNESFPASFSQPHTLKWNNSFKYKRFMITTSFKLASGKPYSSSPIITTFTSGDQTQHYLTYNNINNKRLPLFHQLDLTIMYTIKNKKEWKAKFGISCLNVYNKRNTMNRSYGLINDSESLTGSLPDLYLVEKDYLYITPNAVIRVEF